MYEDMQSSLLIMGATWNLPVDDERPDETFTCVNRYVFGLQLGSDLICVLLPSRFFDLAAAASILTLFVGYFPTTNLIQSEYTPSFGSLKKKQYEDFIDPSPPHCIIEFILSVCPDGCSSISFDRHVVGDNHG